MATELQLFIEFYLKKKPDLSLLLNDIILFFGSRVSAVVKAFSRTGDFERADILHMGNNDPMQTSWEVVNHNISALCRVGQLDRALKILQVGGFCFGLFFVSFSFFCVCV
jgi:hypothetical protein